MLNDSTYASEEILDDLEITNDDSDFRFDMNKHHETEDLLEPGDLVGLYS